MHGNTNGMQQKKAFDWNAACRIYLVLLLIGMLCFYLIKPAYMKGETDEALLPAVSILSSGNFGVSDAEKERAYSWFSEWRDSLLQLSMSGRLDLRGEEMSYYFPTYAMVSAVVMGGLKVLHLPVLHTFSLTNVLCLMGMLYLVHRHARLQGFPKLLLLIALSVNPILAYVDWPSMEVLMYCLLCLVVLFWCNRCFHRAAALLAIAGTMNLTVMATGFFMIFDYLLTVAGERPDRRFRYLLSQWKRIILYGCCYLIVFIPFVYNYVQIGTFNIIISGTLKNDPGTFMHWGETLSRMWCYLTDLNLGYLPYYLPTLITFAVLVVLSVIRRKRQPLLMLGAWLLTLLCYSFFGHINCGMEGIARYNAWSAALILMGVFYLLPGEIRLNLPSRKRMTAAGLCLCLLFTITSTNFYLSEWSPWTKFTPLARMVLKSAPKLYNPLYSTFNSRSNGIDGGYNITTPVVYNDEWTNKILLQAGEGEAVLAKLYNADAQKDSIRAKLAGRQPDEYVYLSFSDREQVLYARQDYQLGTRLNFAASQGSLNGAAYFSSGLSDAEHDITWTALRTARMILAISDYQGGGITCRIDCRYVLDDEQPITILVNNVTVFDGTVTTSDPVIEFDIPGDCIPSGAMQICFTFPQAHSPGPQDARLLGIAIASMTFTAQ